MFCNPCNYKTTNKSNYLKHLKTKKHLGCKSEECHICPSCDKPYKSRMGLWKHRQECKINDTNQLLVQLIQQNNELQKRVVSMSLNTYVQNIQTNHFNLNFFLNETCKDAINISEFVDSLKVRERDLEETGQIGFIDGMCKIIINGLQKLELHKRPIHCSDIKREIIYIKDQNSWERENEEKDRLKRAINTITIKNTKTLSEWQKNNPSYMDVNSKKNGEFINIISNNFTSDETDSYNKIIKKLAKETIIQKM